MGEADMIEKKFDDRRRRWRRRCDSVYAPGEGKYPGLLFYTDIFGIRPANQGMAKRVAEQGYAVLMPNVFYRYGKLPFARCRISNGANRALDEDDRRPVRRRSRGAMMEKDAPHYVKALLDRDGRLGRQDRRGGLLLHRRDGAAHRRGLRRTRSPPPPPSMAASW